MNNYQKYLDANHYLNEGLIRTSVPDVPNKRPRREWMIDFLEDLGHPEKAFPAIHVAGTSGKGSTCVMLAEILRASGLKVGLHVTPYLQVATEKLWVDGKYASVDEFSDLIEWIKPICEKWRSPEAPLHGMASFGICLEHFRRQNVDIAVIETGVGGRDDLTNILNTKLSVITPLGIDHVKTLGSTIEEIAEHKAGIIKPKTPVVAFKGDGSEIIERVAREKNAPLKWVEPNPDTKDFQKTNLQIATAAAKALEININHCTHRVWQAVLPGRVETLQENPKVIIDGAHNFQKLSALFANIEHIDTLIFGMLESKASDDILRILKSFKGKIILTKPQVYGKDPANLQIEGAKIIDNPKTALEYAIKSSSASEIILVTGSLYLTGNIRETYHNSESILERKTSW